MDYFSSVGLLSFELTESSTIQNEKKIQSEIAQRHKTATYKLPKKKKRKKAKKHKRDEKSYLKNKFKESTVISTVRNCLTSKHELHIILS